VRDCEKVLLQNVMMLVVFVGAHSRTETVSHALTIAGSFLGHCQANSTCL
jgi:hypothetical protein